MDNVFIANLLQIYDKIFKDKMAVTKTAAALLVVGLVIGVVAGYGVGFITYQPQISQLQSDLSETESALSTSQSEVESLRGQLTEATDKLARTEGELTKAQTTITSLETQLTESETKYTTLSSEYDEFKSDVTSIINSLKKKLDLEVQFINFEAHYWSAATGEELISIFLSFDRLVEAVGDVELSRLWSETWTNAMREQSEQEGPLYFNWNSYLKLIERNSALIQSDLSKLVALLAS